MPFGDGVHFRQQLLASSPPPSVRRGGARFDEPQPLIELRHHGYRECVPVVPFDAIVLLKCEHPLVPLAERLLQAPFKRRLLYGFSEIGPWQFALRHPLTPSRT